MYTSDLLRSQVHCQLKHCFGKSWEYSISEGRLKSFVGIFLFKQQRKETIFHVLVFLMKWVRICVEKNIHTPKDSGLNTLQLLQMQYMNDPRL